MPPPLRHAAALAALLLAAACTDRGPLLPADLPPPPGASPVAALRCTVTLGGGARLQCSEPAPSAGAAAGSIIVGGQHLFVQLASSGASFAADTFSVDVTVRSLLAQPLGTADGTTTSGVHVFFHTLPVAAPSGTVTVANPDGTGMFTGAAQPYFTYPQVIQPGAVSAPRTWKFHVQGGATSFSFSVYVATELPDPDGLFRWVRLDGGGSEAGTPGSTRTVAVRALNRRGEGVPGVPVAWSVVAGGGSLSAAANQTDASGRAEVAWTLGASAGTHRVDAAGAGLAQSFLAPIPDGDGRLSVSPALQGGAAISAVIGPEGGALQTTGADGTLYVLTVPAGALQDPETLTMTPIASLPDLPLPGGMMAGVQLAPSGLTFTLPVNLTMVVPEGTPTTDLVGFGYAGAGEGLHLQPAAVAGRAMTLYLSHFSGAGGGDGGGGIPDPLRPAGQIASEAMAMAALAILDFEARITGRGSQYRTAVHGVLLSWWLNGVKPDLQHATTNDGALNDAAAQYAKWKVTVQRYDADLTAQEAEGKQLLVAGFRNAILKAGDRCTATKSLAEAARMVRLAEKSMALGLADEDPALSDAEVRLVLCVEAKVAPPPVPPTLEYDETAQVPFVPNLLVSSRYQERYRPGGGELRAAPPPRPLVSAESQVNAPLHVTVTRQGTAETAVMTATVNSGDTLRVPVTANADTVRLQVKACVRAPGEDRLDDVCTEVRVTPRVGSTIYYSSFRGNVYHAVRPDGTGSRIIDSEVEHGNRYHGILSADGTVITYATSSTIWLVRTDGSGRTGVGLDPEISPQSAALSPDRSTLAFQHTAADERDEDGNRIYYYALSTMSVSGGGRTERTRDWFADPDWSPDGTQLVGTGWDAAAEEEVISTMALSGGAPKALAAGRRARWSPDGSRVVFQTNGGIRIVDVASGAVQTVTGNGADHWPAWSPDGRQIVFRRGESIYLIRMDGTGLRPLGVDGFPVGWR